MLLRVGRTVDEIAHCQLIGFHRLAADLAAADAAAALAAPLQFLHHIQPQARTPAAGLDIAGRDVANDAVDPRVDRDVRLDIRDQFHQLFGAVRLITPLLPKGIQRRFAQQLGGVDLDLVRAKTARPHFLKIRAVRIRRGAQQIGHPVQHDLESGCPQQGAGIQGRLHVVPAAIQPQDFIIETLRAHLHFRNAQGAHESQFSGVDGIRACFHHQAHIAAAGGLIDCLGFFKRSALATIHGIQAAFDEFFAVCFRIGAPGAAQDEQFYLVSGMTDGQVGIQAGFHLQIRIEIVLESPGRSGFFAQVAFGELPIVGAEQAFSRAIVRLGQHGHRGDARERTHRFHADARQQRGILGQ